MLQKSISAVALLTLLCSPAWAINKCTVDGNVTFQDAPCKSGTGAKIDVRPASGNIAAPSEPQPGDPTTTATKKPTEAERIEKQIAASQRDRRIRTIEETDLPAIRNSISAKQVACRSEIANLSERKRGANNNLAGATWEQSLSSEMNAVATRCDTETRTLSGDMERLQKELANLHANKASMK